MDASGVTLVVTQLDPLLARAAFGEELEGYLSVPIVVTLKEAFVVHLDEHHAVRGPCRS